MNFKKIVLGNLANLVIFSGSVYAGGILCKELKETQETSCLTKSVDKERVCIQDYQIKEETLKLKLYRERESCKREERCLEKADRNYDLDFMELKKKNTECLDKVKANYEACMDKVKSKYNSCKKGGGDLEK